MRSSFARGHLAGYATIGALAVVPTICLAAIGIPPAQQASPYVPISLSILAILVILRPLQLVATRHQAPTRQLVADVRTHWRWGATVIFLAVALPQTLVVAGAIKKHISDFQPYYADAALMQIDAIFGVEPWQLTHRIFGATATRAIDLVYAFWHAAQIGLACWIVLARNDRFKLQAALSYQLAWLLLSGVLAVAVASVGPCFVDDFYGDNHFAGLMARLPDDLTAVRGMNYLLETQGQDTLGGGISAMPSLHVAIAILLALCVRDRLPRWQWLAWSYALVIFVGSIHLGWHYASDGIVAAVSVLAIWRASGWYLNLTTVSAAKSAALSPEAAASPDSASGQEFTPGRR